MGILLKLAGRGVWGLLQLLAPWWFGTPSSEYPYRSRRPQAPPLPPKKPKTGRAS